MKQSGLQRFRAAFHSANGMVEAAAFSQLVAHNRARLCFDRPEQVFEATGTPPVTKNTQAVEEWAARTGNRSYAQLLDYLEVVPWAEVVQCSRAVVASTCSQIRAIKEEKGGGENVVVVALFERLSLTRSGAWFTGFAWDQGLSGVVDFVAEGLYVFADASAATRQSLADVHLVVVVVDDAVYSGMAVAEMLEHSKFVGRITAFVAAPYATNTGLRRIERTFRYNRPDELDKEKKNLTLVIPPEMQTIPSMPAEVARAMEGNPQKFFIAFEHKLADAKSIDYGLVRGRRFVSASEPLPPPLIVGEVEVSAARTDFDPTYQPFYKSVRMKWRSPVDESIVTSVERAWSPGLLACAGCGSHNVAYTCGACASVFYCSLGPCQNFHINHTC